MIDTMSFSRAHLPDPATAPELFEGILKRRVLAYILDLALIVALTVLLMIVGVIFGVLTFGLGMVALPFIIPASVILYYALTLGSRLRATMGMWTFDIVLTPVSGRPLDGWRVLIHPIAFWVTAWFSWPVSFAIALLTPRREMLHDYITGTLMVRRSPMVRHWRQARV